MASKPQLDTEASSQLREVCRDIAARRFTLEQWSAIESSDEFQTDCLVGGFEALESAFTFSYYDSSRTEWWFGLTLSQAETIAVGAPIEVELRAPA